MGTALHAAVFGQIIRQRLPQGKVTLASPLVSSSGDEYSSSFCSRAQVRKGNSPGSTPRVDRSYRTGGSGAAGSGTAGAGDGPRASGPTCGSARYSCT